MPDRPLDLDATVQQTLRELMQGDYALLLQTFRRDTESRLARLRSSLDEQDWESFRQTAHSLKGSCGNMGALAMQQLCHEAEQAAVQQNAAAAFDAQQELARLYLRLSPLLSD